jgi:hypothetical protein
VEPEEEEETVDPSEETEEASEEVDPEEEDSAEEGVVSVAATTEARAAPSRASPRVSFITQLTINYQKFKSLRICVKLQTVTPSVSSRHFASFPAK